MKKLRIKKTFFGAMMFLAIGGGLIFLVFKNQALALSPNYSKSGASNPLSIAEWNNLRLDFLAKSGGSDGIMTGELNMSNLRVANVGDYTDQNDVVTKAYVDSVTTAAGGGAVFTNWGSDACPATTVRLYSGMAFGPAYDDSGGSNNSICIQSGGTAGGNHSSPNADKLFPAITSADATYIPSELTTTRFIRCAVCYKQDSSCYEVQGDWGCYTGFSPEEGYLLSSLEVIGNNYSSVDRICISRNFNSTLISGSTPSSSRARMYGSIISNNFGQAGYTINRFTRCAICCN